MKVKDIWNIIGGDIVLVNDDTWEDLTERTRTIHIPPNNQYADWEVKRICPETDKVFINQYGCSAINSYSATYTAVYISRE